MATSVAAHAGIARQQSWLVFALGPYVMCASALDVEGIVTRPQSIARVPFAPDYALGAFLFRGSTAAAISLRKKLRLPEHEHPEASPFVVSRIAGAVVAFSVDEVRDVLDEHDLEWRGIPSPLAGGLFDRLAIRGGSLILQTSFAALRDIEVDLAPVANWLSPRNDGEIGAPGRSLRDEANSAVPDTGLLTAKESRGAASQAKVEEKAKPESGPRKSALADIALPAIAEQHNRASAARASSRSQRKLPIRSALAAATASKDLPRIGSGRGELVNTSDGNSSSSSRADETGPSVPGRGRRRVTLAIICGAAALVAALYVGLAVPGLSGRGTLVPGTPASGLTSYRTSASASEPALPERHAPIVQDSVASRGTAVAPSDRQPDVRPTGRTHTVVAGETLWGIAKKEAGDPFRYPELAKLSNIADPDLIRPDEIVRIR